MMRITELFIDFVVFAVKAVAVLSVALVAIGCAVWLFRSQHPEVWRGADPYECFGAGRYDAMREGKVCPGWEDK